MASIGLAEAAKLTGRNQSTIHRAMKTGWLSYTVGENGERRIDTSELHRVFNIGKGAMPDAMAQPVQSHVAQSGELAALHQQLDDRDATIRDLRGCASFTAAALAPSSRWTTRRIRATTPPPRLPS
jgi:hypothetical protein